MATTSVCSSDMTPQLAETPGDNVDLGWPFCQATGRFDLKGVFCWSDAKQAQEAVDDAAIVNHDTRPARLQHGYVIRGDIGRRTMTTVHAR